jgi:hypothetical protein
MNITKKSRMTSFFLTLFLGPLGALYGTVIGGFILLVIAVVTASTIVGPLICWFLAIGISDSAVVKHNEGVDKLLEALANRPAMTKD